MTIVLITIAVSALLAFVVGLALGFFREKFKVERDPKVDRIRAVLPSVNCGACGYPGCDAYAEAVAASVAQPNLCTTGGKQTSAALAEILGVAISAEDQVAVLVCQGTQTRAPLKGEYVGIKSCKAAKLSAGGTKLCAWGCYGYGDCETACPFDAIHVGRDGIPAVDFDDCTGCGQCVKACPQKILILSPRNAKGAIPLCSNRNPQKAQVRKTCSVGCFKCEICVKNCPEKCISMQNLLPVVDLSHCTSCGVCVEKCPTKVYVLLQQIPGRPNAPSDFPSDRAEAEQLAKAAAKALEAPKEAAPSR